MRLTLTAGLGLALIGVGGAQGQIAAVETPHGTARIEGTTRHPDVERLVIGDHVVVKPEPDSAQQMVWIEAELGDLLLVGLASMGNGCFTEYVFIHTGEDEDLRVSPQFGTCGGNLEVSRDDDTVRVAMDSLNAEEGRLEYTYDGQKITERVTGQLESHSPPTASARNWIGHNARKLFETADWREPLVSLMGEQAYKEAQDLFWFSEDMDFSEGWIAGMGSANTDTGVRWCAVAINDDDRRLLVVMGGDGEVPRFWGDARGPLPAPIVEAIGKKF